MDDLWEEVEVVAIHVECLTPVLEAHGPAELYILLTFNTPDLAYF